MNKSDENLILSIKVDDSSHSKWDNVDKCVIYDINQ